MKIITLLPVKNESWVLDFSLTHMSIFSDEIIILDDNSEDDTAIIARKFPKVRVIHFQKEENFVDMSLRRNILLTEGRKAQGTHFVMLDADEIFSETFSHTIKKHLQEMTPGETILFPWILVEEQDGILKYDQKQKSNFKDFIFCDDRVSTYKQQFLSEARTPNNSIARKTLPFESGCVYHFQNIIKKRNQLKQAWYQANELIKGERSPLRINVTYHFTKNLKLADAQLLQDSFIAEHFHLIKKDSSYSFYIERLVKLFEEKGILFFEPLDIWHNQELRDIFIKEIGREPKPKILPLWLQQVNTIKNNIKNWYAKPH